jgi:beta-glucanase (GH16 family)
VRQSVSRNSIIQVVSVGVVAALSLVAATSPGTVVKPQWSKVWTDNFTGKAGTGVNPTFWKYDVGHGIFGTGEVQTMTNSLANVHQDGGALSITALDNHGAWSSGRVQTKSSAFAAPVGGELTVTASIKQSSAGSGPGYWPAFWMLGQGQWPAHGEIDIMEDVNSLSELAGALHCGNLTSVNPDGTTGPCHEHTGLSSGLLPCTGCESGDHVYSITVDRRDASDQQIRWDLDGHQVFAVNEAQVGSGPWTTAVDHGFSIILDLAIGGSYPDSVCNCTSPTAKTDSGGTMSVKYVSVSELKS